MKKLLFIAALLTAGFNSKAQMSKAEVEGMIKGINLAELKDIYLIRTRAKNGADGWSEKSEEFDPKTIKWEFGEKSVKAEGSSYMVLIPYDKIKVIFLKKTSYLTIELVD
ncbi:MAG: hypothetical protein ACXVPN_15040 [Bacteroidia bacterium]